MISAEAALVGCRFAFYLGALFLWGAASVCLLVPGDLQARLWHSLRGPVDVAIGLVITATLATLPVRSAAITGGWGRALDPATLQLVALQTRIGAAWCYQLGAALLLLFLAVVSRSRPQCLATSLTVALAAAFLLAAPVLSGHAALHGGWLQWVHRANDWLHLLAGGFWFGALYPVWRLLGHLEERDDRSSAVIGLINFSRAGHIAVAVIILTGISNTWLILGGWPSAAASLYQMLLWVKIALAALMVGIALLNRYRFVPMIGSDARALRCLKCYTILEITLAIGVMGLVAAFGMLSPA